MDAPGPGSVPAGRVAGPWVRRLVRRGWQPLLWAVFVLAAVGMPLLLGVGEPDGAELPAWLPRGPAALIAVHALLVAVAAPNTIFCLAAGALFGFGWGAVVASVGTGLGSLTAFVAARIVLGRFSARILGRFPRVGTVFRVLGGGGVRIVLLTRLSPLIPFAAQNYGWALTPVRFRTYAAGSLLAAPVGATLFAHIGAAGSAGVSLASGRWSGTALLTVLGAIATFLLVRWISRAAGAALEGELGSDAG